MVGSVAENTMRIIYTDLGLELDPSAMAESSRWLNDYTADLFDGGLPWCAGAQELLEELAAEDTPMALVTNTQRALTERALNGIGRHYFSATVCGDEVVDGKPAPDPYLRAAELLGLAPQAVPGRRGLGDGDSGRRGRRMPGPGGAQRCRGASREQASPCFFAGRTRPLRPACYSFATCYGVPRTHRVTVRVIECDVDHSTLRKGVI